MTRGGVDDLLVAEFVFFGGDLVVLQDHVGAMFAVRGDTLAHGPGGGLAALGRLMGLRLFDKSALYVGADDMGGLIEGVGERLRRALPVAAALHRISPDVTDVVGAIRVDRTDLGIRGDVLIVALPEALVHRFLAFKSDIGFPCVSYDQVLARDRLAPVQLRDQLLVDLGLARVLVTFGQGVGIGDERLLGFSPALGERAPCLPGVFRVAADGVGEEAALLGQAELVKDSAVLVHLLADLAAIFPDLPLGGDSGLVVEDLVRGAAILVLLVGLEDALVLVQRAAGADQVLFIISDLSRPAARLSDGP